MRKARSSSPPTSTSSNRKIRAPETARCCLRFRTAAAKACWASSTAPAGLPIRTTNATLATASSSNRATLVWLGWQFDVPEQPNLMRLYAPVAKGVKGRVRAEITVDSKELSHSVADRNHRPYPVLNPDDAALKLTVRDRVEGERRTVPRALWHVEDGARIVMKEGFEPGRIYELVYTAQDPPVAGAGMAAMRDTISFLKYGGAKDEVLGDQNRYLKRAFAFGVSQSGRFLRTYLYNGFNQDERNRKAFDGIMAHVGGAGRGSFNVRFA